MDSPVSMDSSTADSPSITMPSTGTRSPGRKDDAVAYPQFSNGNFLFNCRLRLRGLGTRKKTAD